MDLFLILIAIILPLLYILWRKIYFYWENLGVLQFPLQYPEGNARNVFKTITFGEFNKEYYQKAKKAGVKFAGLYTYIRPTLLIADLDLIKTILVRDFNIFPNRGLYFNEKDDPVSAHLFNIENDGWRSLRQKLTPVFTSGKLKMMFGTISDVTDKLLTVIDKQMEATGQLEVKDTLARFTTDVIGSVAFGIDCNSLEDRNSKFFEFGNKILINRTSVLTRALKTSYRNLARALGMKLLAEDIAEFYLETTKENVEYREKNPSVKRQDFINILVDLKQKNIVTTEQIAAQSFVFFLAGFETSSSTMNYCMYELSLDEEIQDKARNDVRNALNKHGGEFTYEAVGDMTYLEQCINETLRKYPVVVALQRCSIKEYKIPGTDVVLPAGQPITIPVYGIHWDEDIYPNPAKFDPDRFTAEEIAKRHPMAHIPFGEGQRICIGMRFGIVEMKLGLAKILMRYKFTIDRSKTTVPLKISPSNFILTPLEKIFLNIERV